VALIRAATTGSDLGLSDRLDNLARLARQLHEALAQVAQAGATSSPDAQAGLAEVVAQAVAALQAAAEGTVGAGVRASLAASLAAFRESGALDGLLAALENMAQLLAQGDLSEVAQAGSRLNVLIAELMASLEGSLEGLAGFLDPSSPLPALGDRLSALVSALQEALTALQPALEAETDAPPPGFATSILASLRQALARADVSQATEGVPPGLASLAELIDGFEGQLLARIDSVAAAVASESPELVEEVLTALVAQARTTLDRPHPHPALRLSLLVDALTQAVSSLDGPVTEHSETVRALVGHLKEMLASLSRSVGGEDSAARAETGARAVLDAVTQYRESSQARSDRLVLALAQRSQRDAAVVVSRVALGVAHHVVAALRRADAMALPYGATSVVGDLPAAELAPLQQAINEAIVEIARVLDRFIQVAGNRLATMDHSLAGSIGTVLLGARLPSVQGPDQTLRWLAQLQPLLSDEATASVLDPAVVDAVRDLAAASALEAVQTAASQAASLSRLLTALRARPTAGAAQVHQDLERVVEMVGRSLENKLLSPQAAQAVEEDLRAVLSRLQSSLERLLRAPAPDPETAALTEQARRLLTVASTARDALEGQQLLNATAPRAHTPSYAYVEVPVVIGDQRFDARLKVFRDASQSGEPIDPDNARVALRLNTHSFGVVTALVEMKQAALSVDFSFDNEAARAVFESRTPELLRALEAVGLEVSWIAAQVQDEAAPDVFGELGEPSFEPYSISVLA